jgi:hypothetical protein
MHLSRQILKRLVENDVYLYQYTYKCLFEPCYVFLNHISSSHGFVLVSVSPDETALLRTSGNYSLAHA